MFLCIPIVFGCPNKIKPEGQEAPRVCPQCHNLSVIRAKRTMWFELFWLPLIPIHWKHIWICTICQWNQEVQKDTKDAQKYVSRSFQPPTLPFRTCAGDLGKTD
ncbi:hypothetical protein BDN70DRAFT_798842 [Pholiota conissans]|uniref:Zinc-ribbon 15 domain-containing protein n=1 Tax=Pholiota conissans TaxID=109636 RepID=A0A9P5ZAY9_9AGAR|nr:hypothetical protein BDN70DRAFT_798842 [Pholiota conissans]